MNRVNKSNRTINRSRRNAINSIPLTLDSLSQENDENDNIYDNEYESEYKNYVTNKELSRNRKHNLTGALNNLSNYEMHYQTKNNDGNTVKLQNYTKIFERI